MPGRLRFQLPDILETGHIHERRYMAIAVDGPYDVIYGWIQFKVRVLIEHILFVCLAAGLFICTGTSAVENPQNTTEVPAPVHVLLDKAKRLADKGNPRAAIQRLEAFRAKGGPPLPPGKVDRKGYRHFLVDFHLGNYYTMSKNPEAALAAYERTVHKSPGFSAGWFNLAKATYEMAQYETAANAFIRAYDAAAEADHEWLYYAGISFMSADKSAQALDVFRRLTTACKGQLKASWREALVQLLLELQYSREALAHMTVLCQETRGAQRKRWQETLLHQYMAMDMDTKAHDLVHQLTREYPTEPKWWKGLAHFHLSLQQEKKALAALIIYGYLTEPTPEETQLIADLYLSLGVPEAAASHYRTIVDKQPEKTIFKRLIHAYQWSGRSAKQPEKAMFWAVRGAEITGDPEFHLIQGNLLYETDQYEKAMAAYKIAAKDHRYAGRAWLMTAYCAWYNGKTDKAREAVKKASRFSAQKKEAAHLAAVLCRQQGGQTINGEMQ